MAYNFRKMFFTGQNLKHVLITYSFLELLIYFQSWNENQEIYIFTCFWYWRWKILFFYVELKKIPYQQLLTFLSFINIFVSSRLQLFFEIGALKNSAIFWIKNSIQHMFSCKYCKILKSSFFTELLWWLLLHYFKSN